ncbi:glutamate-cysteine ligase family protein [Haladaptatus sp. ZSTT2]|uniref:glutamate-cysteine ligase family protein n=1 Tax=Haladaptatus sp. ZSTT2 TaxID=3120515 RepID=UPI00300E8B5F
MSSHTTQPIRRSIEVEYWVVDEQGELTEPGELVSASSRVEREFVRPLLEIKTTPCETTGQLREELFAQLRVVLDRAEAAGKRLVPLATPLAGEEVTEIPSERTRIQNAVVGGDFEYVRHCAGTHIHVEQQPGHEVDQMNAFVALDPALALVNSSPYYRGERLATGARSKLYRRKAYDSMPHQGLLWSYIDDKREWTRRLERRYEEFVAATLDAGVDRATVEANFDPESAVWTPVQFRKQFGTVEWRSPDAALPGHVVQLADRLADVTATVRDGEVRIEGETGRWTEAEVVLPSFDTVLEYVDAAIEDGLDSEAVRGYLERMGFDIAAYDPLTEHVDDGPTITAESARNRRLECADLLEQEVRHQSVDID